MQVLALRCGELDVDWGYLDSGRPSGVWRRVPVMTFVVDTGDGVLVWDTGMHERCFSDLAAHVGAGVASLFRVVGDESAALPSRLRQAGIDRGEIRWVVNSHLHFDHCGCNHDFPAAACLVRRRELEVWRASPHVGRSDLGDPGALTPFDYEDHHDLLPDGRLRLVDTSGHTVGHQSLIVDHGTRTLVGLGDAAYTADALAEGRVQGTPWDRARGEAALGRLRDLEQDGARLLYAHDPDQWHGSDDITEM